MVLAPYTAEIYYIGMIYSPFRVLPVRYIGYGMAWGELVRHIDLSDKTVNHLYMSTVLFSTSHVIYTIITDGRPVRIVADTLWECFTSVAFPTIIAFHAARLTKDACEKYTTSAEIKKYVPFCVGATVIVMLQDALDGLGNIVVVKLLQLVGMI